MNRPRKPGNRDLPDNLYPNKNTGHYSYKHPLTGKYHSMGSNRNQAILAAKQLNSLLTVQHSLVDRVIGKSNLFGMWLDKYKAIRLSERLSKKTRSQLTYDIELMREHFGNIPIADVSVFHCAEFLDKWLDQGKMRMAARMRSQLTKCIDFAQSQGLIDDNPASKTRPIQAKVKRKRLTKDQFDAIYQLAPLPIQNAMKLAIITLQRREDIAAMRFRDIKDGYLKVKQQKTSRGHGSREDSVNEAAHLMIGVTEILQEVISQCRSTGVVSPYLVHHIKGRRVTGAAHRKVEPGMPLQPDNITRGFATARNKTGLFDGMKASERPTFHEIRSLGAHLYRQQGIDPQALLGHVDAKMTKHYLDGHGIQWTMVEAVLSV